MILATHRNSITWASATVRRSTLADATSEDAAELLRQARTTQACTTFHMLLPEAGAIYVVDRGYVALPDACQVEHRRWNLHHQQLLASGRQCKAIKQFYGTSENAVKTQIWIAVSVYVLVAIVKKRLDLDASLYTLLQILSVTLFEKMPIHQALAGDENRCNASQITNQLNLFDFLTGH